MSSHRVPLTLTVAALAVAVACGGKKPPVANPTAPPPFPSSGSGGGAGPERPPSPPPPAREPTSVPMNPGVSVDPYASMTPEEINDPQTSPLSPAFFAYDSDELDDAARKVLADDAQVLKKYPTWVVTIEGHCDERGTAEYNLALGERRALAAKNYLLSLGVAADRLKTVSYGKEFPFDPGHDEDAFARNRRAHFMLTAK